ncbi:MAG TPA: hypothetical protein VG675_20550 [Bryobacteraceae bacterium]|nr:hypothetical protein [Bryobacteraceae bacterium]
MKKLLGLTALMVSSAALMVSPALAHDRNDVARNYGSSYTVFTYQNNAAPGYVKRTTIERKRPVKVHTRRVRHIQNHVDNHFGNRGYVRNFR